MKRSKKDGDNGNMQKQVLNEIHEENVEYKWANGKSCTVFHGNNLTLKDLITDEQIPNRFFFRLKLLPTSVSSYRLKPLVHNFLKCISFEDCVLVELNDQVAYLFWSELVPLKTSVTGIIQLKNIEEKFRVDNDENEYHQTSNKSYNKYSPKQKRIFPKDAKDNNSLAYSYFKRLIVTQDLRNVNLDLPKGCFVCDIILLQNKSQRNTEIKLAYPTINILPPDVSTAVIGNDELCISFKDACNKTKLRKKIFNEILKHYNLSSSSIEVCYLMFHLNIKEATFDSQNWNAQELQCLIRQCIRYCKPNILIELIDNYKPATSIWNELRNSVTQLSLIEIFSSDNLSDISLESNSISIKKLFESSLRRMKLKESTFYWTKLNSLTCGALEAVYILEKLSSAPENKTKQKSIEKYIRIYQHLATEISATCYCEDKNLSFLLLVHKNQEWKNSCIEKALSYKNKSFLKEPVCHKLCTFLWINYNGLSFDQKCLEKRKWSMSSPLFRLLMDEIGMIFFILLYSIFLLSVLKASTFHWLEVVVFVFQVLLILKKWNKIKAIFSKIKSIQMLTRIKIYGIYLTRIPYFFMFAWVMRWIAYKYPKRIYISRLLFSCDFVLCMFTFLEFLSGHHSFGPMIVMLKKTLKKYIAFFIILLNILVAYSIASESLLYPESEYDDWPSILNIFRKGFWAILGEYNLDEYELKDLDDLCTNNASLYKDFKQCPSEKSSYFVSVFLGMYALFIQIVLSSLIVALITKSIYKIQGDSESIFSHQVFQQVKKYATTRLLLPPFTLLLFRLWKRGNNPFCVELDIDKQLQEFEYSAAQPVIQKIRFARK